MRKYFSVLGIYALLIEFTSCTNSYQHKQLHIWDCQRLPIEIMDYKFDIEKKISLERVDVSSNEGRHFSEYMSDLLGNSFNTCACRKYSLDSMNTVFTCLDTVGALNSFAGLICKDSIHVLSTSNMILNEVALDTVNCDIYFGMYDNSSNKTNVKETVRLNYKNYRSIFFAKDDGLTRWD